MIVYFDTVKRKRPVREGGELVQLDWTRKRVLKRLPIFPADPDIEHDTNPRGNTRGGKGILINSEELFVGNYHSILVFDHQLNLKRKINNNLFVNIHEMCFDGEDIWVAATTIDCAVRVTQKGETLHFWWPREESYLQKKYGLVPMDIDKTADNRIRFIHAELEKGESHTHLNCVTEYNRKIYALLNHQGVFAQIHPEFRIVIEDGKITGAHSPKIINGEKILFCGSFNRSILIFDLHTGRFVNKIDLLAFPEMTSLLERFPDQDIDNRSIFVRGLDILDNDRILIGISPASIAEIDINKLLLLDFFQFSNDVSDAVHGLVHLNSKRHD